MFNVVTLSLRLSTKTTRVRSGYPGTAVWSRWARADEGVWTRSCGGRSHHTNNIQSTASLYPQDLARKGNGSSSSWYVSMLHERRHLHRKPRVVMMPTSSSLVNVMPTFDRQWLRNKPISQIPKCTCHISHNAPFRTEMYTFLFWMLYCGTWDRCILGFVRLIFWHHDNFRFSAQLPFLTDSISHEI